MPLISENRPDIDYQVNIYPWIHGINLKTWSTSASLIDCYLIGEKCGHLLNMIHNATVTDRSSDFDITSCLMKNIKFIEKSKIVFPNMNKLLSKPHLIINQLRRDIPATLIHFDFKPKNIMFSHKELHIVDWDSCIIADPWLDFWDKGLSIYPKKELFNVGLLEGYFDYAIPKEFWIYFQALTIFAFYK